MENEIIENISDIESLKDVAKMLIRKVTELKFELMLSEREVEGLKEKKEKLNNSANIIIVGGVKGE